jgi:Zn-dependent protease with chaperone function
MFPQTVALGQTIVRNHHRMWILTVVVLFLVHLIALGVTWLSVWTALWPWKRSSSPHWSERARLSYPARKLAGKLLLLLPIAAVASRLGHRLPVLPEVLINYLLVVAAWTGVLQAGHMWARRLNPAMDLTPRPASAMWISNWAITGVLVAAAFAVYGAVPREPNWRTLLIIAASVLIVGAYLNWGWSHLMRATGLIRTSGARLRAVVWTIADRMDVRPDAVVELSLPMANAFAFVTHRSVGATDAALAVLDDDELEAVCAHEMGHLSEPHRVRTARLSQGFLMGVLVVLPTLIGRSFTFDPNNGLDPSVALHLGTVALIAIFLVGTILHANLSRRMEIRADALGRKFEPVPGSYARALEKLYATNMVPAVAQKKKRSHPELYDRLVDAGVPPEYPRPSPPSQWPVRAGLFVAFVGVVAGGFGLEWLLSVVTNR